MYNSKAVTDAKSTDKYYDSNPLENYYQIQYLNLPLS